MKTAGTYKITRQGQITLPAEAREELHLQEGDSVEMYYSEHLVVIKKRRTPLEVLEELAEKTTKRFRERGITRADVAREIAAVRKGH